VFSVEIFFNVTPSVTSLTQLLFSCPNCYICLVLMFYHTSLYRLSRLSSLTQHLSLTFPFLPRVIQGLAQSEYTFSFNCFLGNETVNFNFMGGQIAIAAKETFNPPILFRALCASV